MHLIMMLELPVTDTEEETFELLNAEEEPEVLDLDKTEKKEDVEDTR